MKKIVLFIAVFLLSLNFAFADFGVVISEGFLIEDKATETDYSSKTIVAPWFSYPFGNSDLYVSAGASLRYENTWSVVPELFKLELALRPSPRFALRLGRILWQDPSLFTAFGYLDGMDISFNLGGTRIGLAGFYTGFLNMDTASINISPGDPNDYSKQVDWDNFSDTYFAPRRVIASLYGDFPGFPYGRGNIHAGLMAQFDLSETNEKYNTQYLLLRYTFYYKSFDLSLAGAADLENTEANGYKLGYAFNAELGLQTGLLKDRFSIGARYASGSDSDTAAFFPLIREAQGAVLTPVLSGIMIARARYQVRLSPSVGVYVGGRYFIRTDSTTFIDPYIDNDSRLLGLEADGSIQWNPVSDLAFTLGGGVYFPQTAPAMDKDAPLRWSLKVSGIFSF